jgi:hypothetical protein
LESFWAIASVLMMFNLELSYQECGGGGGGGGREIAFWLEV